MPVLSYIHQLFNVGSCPSSLRIIPPACASRTMPPATSRAGGHAMLPPLCYSHLAVLGLRWRGSRRPAVWPPRGAVSPQRPVAPEPRTPPRQRSHKPKPGGGLPHPHPGPSVPLRRPLARPRLRGALSRGRRASAAPGGARPHSPLSPLGAGASAAGWGGAPGGPLALPAGAPGGRARVRPAQGPVRRPLAPGLLATGGRGRGASRGGRGRGPRPAGPRPGGRRGPAHRAGGVGGSRRAAHGLGRLWSRRWARAPGPTRRVVDWAA